MAQAETERLRPVLIRMTPELHDAIKAIAAAEERSIATTMRRALRQYVERAGGSNGTS
jgi:predicted transcriptional regulator